MAGYAGLVSVGQQAFVGFGGYILFALTIFVGLPPIVAIAAAGVLGAIIAVPMAALIFPAARRVLRDWHVGLCRSIPAFVCSDFQPWRRVRFVAARWDRALNGGVARRA